MAADKRKPSADDDLDWFTISYRTIYTAVALVLLAGVGSGLYFYLKNRPAVQLPTPETTPTFTTARFTSIDGSVRVKPAGRPDWMPADKSQLLGKGDLVRTGTTASAEVTFYDGTVVHVRPDSLITIEESGEDPSTKRRRVGSRVSSGDVNYLTSSSSADFKISTPTLTFTAAEQTDGGVRVAETGASDVRVFKGSVRGQTTTGQDLSLGAREAARVSAAGQAGPKLVLLPPPRLLAPPHQTEVSYVDPSRATTLLVWNTVPGATSYHVMLDDSPYFNSPLADRPGLHDTSVELRGLDVGKYYWRVAAVDKDGVAGPFADFARFTVAQPTGGGQPAGPPPPLKIDAVDVSGNVVQLKGRTEAGARVTVNDQSLEVQADGTFSGFVQLKQTGNQVLVVKAVGRDGGVSELRRPIVAGF